MEQFLHQLGGEVDVAFLACHTPGQQLATGEVISQAIVRSGTVIAPVYNVHKGHQVVSNLSGNLHIHNLYGYLGCAREDKCTGFCQRNELRLRCYQLLPCCRLASFLPCWMLRLSMCLATAGLRLGSALTANLYLIHKLHVHLNHNTMPRGVGSDWDSTPAPVLLRSIALPPPPSLAGC